MFGQGAGGSVSRCGGGLFDEIEYHRQKKSLEWELDSLLIPEVDVAKEAGRLLADMPRLWTGATLQERHQLLTMILDAGYIDMKGSKSIVSVKAKPAFHAVLGVVGSAGEALDDSSAFAVFSSSQSASVSTHSVGMLRLK